ncbi:DUF3987 domain-containing protein [Phocaeicola sp.]
MEFSKTCSFYFNMFEHHSTDMTLEEFVGYIISGRWRAQVEEYQRLVAAGETQKAKAFKRKFPGMVVAGQCEGGRALANLKTSSGEAMFDMDHSDEQTQSFLHVLKQTAWVKAGWRSTSHNGAKVVVRIEAENAEEYTLAYAIVAWHISQLIGFPCDMSCKDLARACFASYDPEAFFKADAEVFPWRKFAQENPEKVEQILKELKVKCAATHHPSNPQSGTPPDASRRPVPATGMLRAFFNDFLAHNAFIGGKRNDFLLKLGRIARYKGLSEDELKQLETLAVERLGDADCTPGDILSRVDAGYRYADASEVPVNQPFAAPFKDHKDQGPSMCDSGPCSDAEKAENEKYEAYKLKERLPHFPDRVYKNLPGLITRGLAAARGKREKDRLLMGMLANLSACLPGVWMSYAGAAYSPHFYFLALAGAGRGKGVVSLGAILPNAIQRYLGEQDAREGREFEEKWKEWELEERKAAQAKRVPDLDKRPEKPVKRMLKISPNISKSQLIIALAESGAKGAVINASELDALSNALNQDCGKHDDVFRAAFHHEEISSYFKTDGHMIIAESPHLALCLSGTPAQLHRFISSLENGMYSRMVFYIPEGRWLWKSAAPRKDLLDSHALFEELGEELLRLYLFLSQSPTEVRFSDAQWEEHTRRFSTALQEVVSEDDDSQGAIVLRHGLVAARIAMVLTALRKCEPMWNTSLYECTDEDFRTAMDIVAVLLQHSLLLSTSLAATASKEVKVMKKFYRIRPVLAKMPKVFTFTELLAVAVAAGISPTSLKRYLVRLVEMKLLVKEEDSYRKSGRSWPRKA